MMAAIGLDRTSAYIANIIPWRPPGNRTPTPQESQICLPFIQRQIELANPDILVCIGGPATQTLLGVKDGIKRTRGRWFAFDTGTREIRAIATFHPAYLLRSPLGEAPRLARFSGDQEGADARLGLCPRNLRDLICLMCRVCRGAIQNGPRPPRPPAVRFHDRVPHHLPDASRSGSPPRSRRCW